MRAFLKMVFIKNQFLFEKNWHEFLGTAGSMI